MRFHCTAACGRCSGGFTYHQAQKPPPPPAAAPGAMRSAKPLPPRPHGTARQGPCRGSDTAPCEQTSVLLFACDGQPRRETERRIARSGSVGALPVPPVGPSASQDGAVAGLRCPKPGP